MGLQIDRAIIWDLRGGTTASRNAICQDLRTCYCEPCSSPPSLTDPPGSPVRYHLSVHPRKIPGTWGSWVSTSGSPLPTGEIVAKATPWVWHCPGLKEGSQRETIPLTPLRQFFLFSVFQGRCFSLTSRVWGLHKGILSISSC